MKRVVLNPILFGLGVAILLNMILPLVFSPDLDHTLAIYHAFLHGAGLAISIFFSIIAILAYLRVSQRSLGVLLMATGFVTLSISEAFYFIDASELLLISPAAGAHFENPIPIVELSHIASYAMLILFSIGIMGIRRGKRRQNDQFLQEEN
jgi:hypothetical protein